MHHALSSVESFIRRDVKTLLSDDLGAHRIIKEADMQACFYYHLRRFLKRDSGWRVYTEKATPHGNFIDLVLYHRGRKKARPFVPKLAIELKWRRNCISAKDRRSLAKALKRLRVRKAYFFAVNLGRNKYLKTSKHAGEKYHLLEVVVTLPAEVDYPDWLIERKRIRTMADVSRRGRA